MINGELQDITDTRIIVMFTQILDTFTGSEDVQTYLTTNCRTYMRDN